MTANNKFDLYHNLVRIEEGYKKDLDKVRNSLQRSNYRNPNFKSYKQTEKVYYRIKKLKDVVEKDLKGDDKYTIKELNHLARLIMDNKFDTEIKPYLSNKSSKEITGNLLGRE